MKQTIKKDFTFWSCILYIVFLVCFNIYVFTTPPTYSPDNTELYKGVCTVDVERMYHDGARNGRDFVLIITLGDGTRCYWNRGPMKVNGIKLKDADIAQKCADHTVQIRYSKRIRESFDAHEAVEIIVDDQVLIPLDATNRRIWGNRIGCGIASGATIILFGTGLWVSNRLIYHPDKKKKRKKQKSKKKTKNEQEKHS